MYDKVLYGVAGAAGAGVVAWKTMFPWINHDLKVMNVGRRLKSAMDQDAQSGQLLVEKFEEHVAKQPKKPFIIFEGNVFTYEYVDQQANKVANIVRSWGLKAEDTVAMMVYNEPAFVWTFLGLQKIGVVSALINFNLRQIQLSHSVIASDAKAFIVGAGEDLFHAVLEEEGKFGSMPIYFQGRSAKDLPAGYHSFEDQMATASSAGLDPSVREGVTPNSNACFIYTSGTTGLPKPAYISHAKACGISTVLHVVAFHSDDILYVMLPLYHTSGGGIGMFSVIRFGATMVLRRKFSATHFFEDCCRYKVTIIQYIGELFRYLLARPKSPAEQKHCIRAAFGNGLRRDIWVQVANRFNIPLIAEFFGATEGTTMLFNVSRKPGAVGRVSPLLEKLSPHGMALVKYDFVTAEPLRDKNGRCIRIKPGEKGLFLSGIPPEFTEMGHKFYKASESANEKKIVRNAFVDGDLYFNYGDLLYLDKEYFVYFSDRIGDTFRWKGENVSTTEVANILTGLDFIHDANVYGVTVPGHDGRAGMVSLTLHDDKPLSQEFLQRLWSHCEEYLASYARPMFIRLLKEAIQTSTFKQQKVKLVEEGFDPNKVSDPLFYADPKTRSYIPITDGVYARIITTSKL